LLNIAHTLYFMQYTLLFVGQQFGVGARVLCQASATSQVIWGLGIGDWGLGIGDRGWQAQEKDLALRQGRYRHQFPYDEASALFRAGTGLFQ
jgi:hypothetical protein